MTCKYIYYNVKNIIIIFNELNDLKCYIVLRCFNRRSGHGPPSL